MKNSLFKRAVATVATVPLALTQCFTVAASTSVVAADDGKTVTLNKGVESSILYIAPDESDAEYIKVSDTLWTKEADWNFDIHGTLSSIASGNNASGVIDMQSFYDKLISNAGDFGHVTEELCSEVGEVTYSVAKNGDVTIKATLNDIVPRYSKGSEKTIGGVLKKIGRDYGIAELSDPSYLFSDMYIGGDVTVTVLASSLQDGTEIKYDVEFKDGETGTVYKGIDVVEWALSEFDRMEVRANDIVDSFADEYGIDREKAAEDLNEVTDFYTSKLKNVEKGVDKVLAANATRHYDTMADAISGAENFFNEKSEDVTVAGKTVKELANKVVDTDKLTSNKTAAEFAETSIILQAYDSVLNQLNAKVAPDQFDITAEELGEFADTFTDIEVSVVEGVATLKAIAPDAEKDAAIAYIESAYPVTVLDCYKKVEVTVDLTAVKNSTAKTDFVIEREVVVEPIVTTTTTEATTTTSDEQETTTAEPETTTSDEQETTTAEPETTTSDEQETTTAEPETTTTDEEETTTASTTDEEEETTTTTTVTDDKGYIVVETTVVNFQCESGVGFYLTLDEEFNAGQVDKLTYTIDRVIAHIDEEGNVVEQEFIEGSDPVDITDMVAFEGTPGDAYMATNTTFKYEIPIVAAETIKAEDGAVIATVGQPFNQPSGAQVLITTYIGLKGDGNLNNRLDTSDASFTLKWYSIVSTMEDGKVPADYKFSESDLVTSNTDVIDDFALFLCDINNFDAENNYKLTKNARAFTTTEASRILKAYSYASTTNDPNFSLAKWDWAEIE